MMNVEKNLKEKPFNPSKFIKFQDRKYKVGFEVSIKDGSYIGTILEVSEWDTPVPYFVKYENEDGTCGANEWFGEDDILFHHRSLDELEIGDVFYWGKWIYIKLPRVSISNEHCRVLNLGSMIESNMYAINMIIKYDQKPLIEQRKKEGAIKFYRKQILTVNLKEAFNK